MYREKAVVSTTMIDFKMKLRPSAFFSLFQDVALRGADDVGVGTKETMDRGMIWVFTRVEAEFLAYPKFKEEVEIVTYPNPSKAMFYPRQAEMRDASGKPLIRLSSLWALLDKETRTVIMKGPQPSETETHPDEMPMPERVTIEKEHPLLSTREIVYTDVDLNKHLNNVRYIEFLLDAYPLSFHETHELSHILINYIHEVHDGDKLDLYGDLSTGEFVGKVKDQIAFAAKLSFREQ